MKYIGMPLGMWLLYQKSFKKQLTDTLNYSKKEAQSMTRDAKNEYHRIIKRLPEFEKDDRFQMNIVSCAMLSAFYLQMKPKPDIDALIAYYDKAMMIKPTKWFCQQMGKKKFSPQDLIDMKKTADFNAADRNPYSWNMDFYLYEDDSGYEARFSKCGICTLMKELGIFEAVPAMCHLDYAMAEAGGVAEFVREYTLATGGPYCDCGYKKKVKQDGI